MTLPTPICGLGYPDDQLHQILGDRYDEFMGWMEDQTTGECPLHGMVVYGWDFQRFLDGRPIVD